MNANPSPGNKLGGLTTILEKSLGAMAKAGTTNLVDVLRSAEPGTTPDERIAVWEESNASRLVRARAALSDIADVGQLDLATLSVAARQIRSMVR
jgi:NAD-specific glutamate dehydrogenase